jgi:hypothetical protein
MKAENVSSVADGAAEVCAPSQGAKGMVTMKRKSKDRFMGNDVS